MRTDIRDFILRDATLEDTSEMIDLIKQRRTKLSKMATINLMAGDKISFTSSRTGRLMVGTVEKVAIKNCIVNTAFGRYRVPANMLEKVQD